MPTYNPNDFYPRTGQEINSAGNVVNPADSVDQNGNQGILINGDKVIGPTLLDTIPYSAFVVSATITKAYSSKLNRGAKKRAIIIVNSMNQPLSACTIINYDSVAYNSGYANSGDAYSAGSLAVNAQYNYSSDSHGSLAGAMDSVQFNLGMGATAPTSGNVLIYITEVF